MHAYNLFRRKGDCELFCAVPEDRIVPSFIDGARWEFLGKLDDAGPSPAGFDARSAATSVRFNGCYLFAAIAG